MSSLSENAVEKDLPDPAPFVSANASSKRLVKNVLIGYITTFATALTGFFTTPLLLRFMGKDKFAIWMMLLSILGYVAMVEVGTYTTVAKRVAECLATDDRKRLSRILATAMLLYAAMSVIALLLVSVLSALLPHLYPHLSPEDRQTARYGLLALGVFQCATFLFAPQSAILFGGGRVDLVSRTTALVNTVQALVNVYLAWLGYGVLALCLCALGGAVSTGVLLLRQARKTIPHARLHLPDASWETARELLKYGSRFSLISIAGALSFSSDVLILGFFLPAASIAQYSVATKLIGFVSILTNKPIGSATPMFAHMETLGDRAGQFRLVTLSGFASLLIATPFVVGFCLLGDRIIHAWVGDGFAESYPILITLSLWLLVIVPAGPFVNLMTATDKNLFMVRAYLVAGVSNVALSVWLTSRLGLIGPAVSSLIAVAVLEFTVLPIVACRIFGFSVRKFWSRLLTPLVTPALAAIGAALGLRALPLPPGNRLLTVGMLLTIVAVCWGTWFFVVLPKEQRSKYTGLLLQRIRR